MSDRSTRSLAELIALNDLRYYCLHRAAQVSVSRNRALSVLRDYPAAGQEVLAEIVEQNREQLADLVALRLEA